MDFTQVARVRFEGAQGQPGRDAVAREEPLEIQLGQASLAVVMRTPGHDEELALGFLVTERVVSDAVQVRSVAHCTRVPVSVYEGVHEGDGEDNVIRATLADGVAVDLERLRRNLFASSSCGICGKASIDNALEAAPPLCDRSVFPAGFFYELAASLERGRPVAQPLFARTGGLHAAALFDSGGRRLVVREDVGRHNAVDKVVGWALGAGRIPLAGHVLWVSGRISFEIVQKALAARIPVIAAVSAPSSLAVAFAERAGLTLVGFLRGRGLNVYGDASRVAAG